MARIATDILPINLAFKFSPLLGSEQLLLLSRHTLHLHGMSL